MSERKCLEIERFAESETDLLSYSRWYSRYHHFLFVAVVGHRCGRIALSIFLGRRPGIRKRLLPFLVVDVLTVLLLSSVDPWIFLSPWEYPLS